MGFTRRYLYNSFARDSVINLNDFDAEILLAHFKTKMEMDHDLFFGYTIDSDDRLENLLWADSISLFDYKHFGYAITFDATYKMNTYRKPLEIIIGINNHLRSCIFGMALIVDETVETYTWVLQTYA